MTVWSLTRELRRNRGVGGYRHKQAQRLADERRSAASSGPRKLPPAPRAIVRALLLLPQWSLEQITGKLARGGVVRISFSWLYKRIHQDRAGGRGCIPARTDISERPAIVNDKQRVGDWEVDTIIGKQHQGAAVTLVDWVSKYLCLQPFARKTAAVVSEAVTGMLPPSAPSLSASPSTTAWSSPGAGIWLAA